MKKILSFLFLFLIQVVSANPTITNYNSSHHDQVINIFYEEPFLIVPGKELIDKGFITMKEFKNRSKARLEEELKSTEAIKKVISDNNKICGYTSYIKNKNENKIYLCCIVISKEIQRNGLGSLLLSNIIDDAKKSNFKSIILEVNNSNIHAQNFYKKHGFYVTKPSSFAKEFNLTCYEKELTLLGKLRRKLLNWKKPLLVGGGILTGSIITYFGYRYYFNKNHANLA